MAMATLKRLWVPKMSPAVLESNPAKMYFLKPKTTQMATAKGADS